MKKYELYYKDCLIGNLEINNESFTYKPYKDNILNNTFQDEIFSFLKEDMDYLHPFLESRIKNMEKFNLTTIDYENDYYKLIKL